MSTHFHRAAGILACAVLAVSAHSARAAASAEQVAGSIEAVLFVCTPLDAKSVKPGQELLQRAVAQRKLDLAAIRKTEAYRVAYNAEANRLLALPQRERITACQTAW